MQDVQPTENQNVEYYLNGDSENRLVIWAGNCLVALDLYADENKDVTEEAAQTIYEITEIEDEGKILHVRPYNKATSVKQAVTVWNNTGLRPVTQQEVAAGICNTDIIGNIRVLYQTYLLNPSVQLALGSRRLATVQELYEKIDTLTTGERNVFIHLVSDMCHQVQEDYHTSVREVNGFVQHIRERAMLMGATKLEENSTVKPNAVAGLKDVLVHIITRFKMEGHSGFTYRSGASHIISSIRKVAKKYKDSIGEDNLITAPVPVKELLEEELRIYSEDGKSPMETLKEWRSNGRIAFYPTLDFSMFPHTATSIVNLPYEELEPLALILDYMLAEGKSIIAYDLSDNNDWNSDDIHGNPESISHIRHAIFRNVYKQTNAETGEQVLYASGSIVFTNAIGIGETLSSLSNYTNHKSGLVLDGATPDTDPHKYYGANIIQAFQDKDDKVVVPEKIDIWKLDQDNLRNVVIQSCNPREFYNLKSVNTDNGTIEMEQVTTGDIKTITKEEFEEVRIAHGKVVKEITYPAYHTWLRKAESVSE